MNVHLASRAVCSYSCYCYARLESVNTQVSIDLLLTAPTAFELCYTLRVSGKLQQQQVQHAKYMLTMMLMLMPTC